MDDILSLSAADLHLVAVVICQLVEAANGGSQEDLFAVDDLQGVGNVLKYLLGQSFQGVVQVV